MNFEWMNFGDVTEEHFDRTFDLNARGTLFTDRPSTSVKIQ
ncbi:hypothetical protein [Streptomyces sp. NPDC056987]